MAYKDIKGIVVEIGGDTSGLQDALKKVNSQAASLSKELRGINSMLKLDPKNTELLAQKQKVLGDEIKATTSYLENCKKALDDFVKSGGDLNSAEYRRLQREVILTENNLKNLTIEASKFTQISNNLSEFSSKMKSLGNTVSDVGKKVSVLSASVAGLFGVGVKYNAELERYQTAFKTFLGSEEEAVKAINNIKTAAQSSPFNTADLVQANQMLITTGKSAEESQKTISALADAIALTGGGNDELTRMAANLQQISNAGKATSMDIRQFAYAGIDVYGILAETTGKNVEELKKMDITYEDLSKALQVAASEGGKYYNGQAQMAETLTGKINKLKKTFQDLTGQLSESLMPIIEKVTDKIQSFVDWFSNLDDGQKQVITRIGLFVVALGPALIIIGKLITAVGVISGALATFTGWLATASVGVGGLSGVITALSGPIGIAVVAIAGLIAVVVNLWNKSEAFRNKVIEIGNSLKNTYNQHIKPTIDNIMSILKALWNDVLKPLTNYFMEKLMPIVSLALETIGTTFANIFEKVGIIIHTATGVLKGFIDFITGVFSGDWKRAWEGVKTIFGNVFDGMKEMFKKPINWIINKLNSFIDGVNKIQIPSWVPGVGGKGFSIPKIPALASGGIVDKATLAMIGEGKSAEAVIPLDRTLTKYMAEAMKQAGGDPIVVNFYPQTMSDAELNNAFNYINRRFGLAY